MKRMLMSVNRRFTQEFREQHFCSDRFFNSSQQARLRELMNKFHNAVKEGQSLSSEEMAELEALVNVEYQGATERAAAILKESSQ